MESSEKCKICNFDDSAFVDENENAIATFFHNQKCHGHVIVASKIHCWQFNDLEKHIVTDVTKLLHESMRKLKKILNCDRFYIMSLGDLDHHFHFHILPFFNEYNSVGPYTFGPNGWASKLDKSKLNETNELILKKWDNS